MSRSTHILHAPSLADLKIAVDAFFVSYMSHKVTACQWIAADNDGRAGIEYRLLIEITSGGAALSAPYTLESFSGKTPEESAALMTAYVVANPALFISPPLYDYISQGSRRIKVDPVVAVACTDATNGESNWSAGGGGGTLAGDVTGPLAANVVGGIQGVPVDATAPTTGAQLIYNGDTAQYEPALPVQHFASGAAAQAGAPFINGTLVVIYPGSPTSEAGTYQVTTNGGAAFPADYTKVSDQTDTASEVGTVDAGNYYGATPKNVEAELQALGPVYAAGPAPAASGSVVSETAFGQSASAGTAGTGYSRGNHTHGTPAAPIVTGLIGARPAANTLPAGTLFIGTDDGSAWKTDGAAWTPVVIGVTALAGGTALQFTPFAASNPSPINGDLWLNDTSNAIEWRMDGVTYSTASLLSSIPTGNTIWVDAVNGNDTTGTRGRQDLPFLTLANAKAAAGIASGDLIIVRPGTYTVAANLFVTGVNWYFEPGATVNFNDAGGTLWMFDGAIVNVYGYADFVGVAGKGLVRTGAGVFQCNKVSGAWGAASGDSVISASFYASGPLALNIPGGINCSTADRRLIYVVGPQVHGYVGGASYTVGSGTNGVLEVASGSIKLVANDLQSNGQLVKLTGGSISLAAQALSGSVLRNTGGTLLVTANSALVGVTSDDASSVTNIIASKWEGTGTVSAGVTRIRAGSGATLGTIAVSGTGVLHLDAQKFDMSSTGSITVSAGSIYLTSNFIAQTVAQTILAVSGTGTAVVNIGSITIGTDAPAVSISGGTLAGFISSITHSGSGSAARGIYQTGGTCDLVMGLLAMTNSGSYAGVRIDGGTSVCRIKADAITAISTNEGTIHNGSQTPTLDLDIGRVSGANASGVATISTLGPTGSIRVGTLTSTSARAFAMTSGSTSVNLSLNFGVVSNTGGSAEVIALAQGFVDVQVGLIKNAGAGVAVSVDTQTATVGRIDVGAIINSGNAPGISLTTKQNQLDVSLGRYVGNSYAINISTSGADAVACNYSISLGQIITTYAGGAVVISGYDINVSISAQIIRNLSANSNAVGLSIANSGTVAAFVECPDISGYRGVKTANTGTLTVSVEAQRITGNVAEAIQVTSAGGAITGSVEAEQITGATDGISLAAGTWDFSLGRVTATSGKALACLTGGTPTFRNAVFIGSANQPGANLLNSITARFIGCTFIGGAGATESITGTATAKFLTPCSANLPKAAGITEQVNALTVNVDVS